MLTARGWWFGSAVVLVTFVGIAGLGHWSATVPLLGLTLLTWFLIEWARFAVGYRSTATTLRVTRQVRQSGREVPAVWSRSPVMVRTVVTASEGVGVEFAVVEDVIAGVEHAPTAGDRRRYGPIRPGKPVVIDYAARCESPGRLRFEGVRVRVTDLQGFFFRDRVIRTSDELLVLPSLTDDRGRQSGRKRFNALPPPGLHRLRRPGSGTELLDLREYRPGDPPKMIAWRPTARRDMLITREFESEVPVRSLLFLDASDDTRTPDGAGTPLARMTEIAAVVTQTATNNRDLIGLTVFDEHRAEHLAPARSGSHLVRVTRRLAETAGRLPGRATADVGTLSVYARRTAARIYPDLLADDVNGRPFSLYWQPLSDSRLFFFVFAMFAWPCVLYSKKAIELLARLADAISESQRGWQVLLALVFVPGLVGGLLWLIHGARGLTPARARQTGRRKQLSALYAHLDGEGPAAVERYLNDDVGFADRSRRFLAVHRVHVPERSVPSRGESPDKVAVLAGALQAVVGRAHDNELYVVFLDVTSAECSLGPLLAAARVARARHHHVMVVVPWPVAAPPTDRPKGGYAGVVAEAAERRRRRRFDEVRRELAAAGVTVTRADAGSAARTVLEQMDRLRGVRVR